MSYAVPRCLHVLAEAGVADALGDQSTHGSRFGRKHRHRRWRLWHRALRLISAYGIFEPRNDGYAHTPASRLLRTDHPQSMRSFVRWIGALQSTGKASSC